MSALDPALKPTLDLHSADPLTPSADSVTPLEFALADCCLSYKQNAPLSPLESALTDHPHLPDSARVKTLCFDTLSDHSHVTPLESALTKNTGGWGTPAVLVRRVRLVAADAGPYREYWI